QSGDLGLEGLLSLASCVAQVLVLGLRQLGPLLGGFELGVDGLNRLLEDVHGRLDRINLLASVAGGALGSAERAGVGVVGAADGVELLFVFVRELSEGVGLLHA